MQRERPKKTVSSLSVHRNSDKWRLCAIVDGVPVHGPVRPTKELANEDLIKASRCLTRADVVKFVRRMHTCRRPRSMQKEC